MAPGNDWTGAEAHVLMKACADGSDPRAWEEFVRRYGPVIERTVRRVAGRWGAPSQDVVADLTQDAYRKFLDGALRGYRHLHADSDFGFVKVVAANVAFDHFRRGGEQPIPMEEAVEPASQGPDPYRTVAVAQIQARLERVLPEKSRDRDRQVFVLYYRHGFTAKAIAQVRSIGLTIKGVESVIHSLTAALKGEL
jgi:RNA polymerase sigma-70 factor (ECF subfamily)